MGSSAQPFRVLGVDFAPLSIPLKRRLETATVLFYTCTFVLFPFLFSLLVIYLVFTDYYWLSLGYVAWIYYDVHVVNTAARGGRRWEWLRHAGVWRHFRDYFPIRLVKTAELPPRENYLLGYHPHGVIGCGGFGNFVSESTGFSDAFPGIRPHMVTLATNFRLPLIRGFLLWMGVCDVSKESMTWILTKQGPGNAAIVVVGGAEEALNAHPGTYDLTLTNRKGFIKMAIKTGASLVPVFSFGENDLFHQANNPSGSLLRSFQNKVKQMVGISPPLFYGRGVFNYSFGMMPFRKPINTVVGRPIDVVQCDNPDQATIDNVHQRYMDELSQLFDEHKVKYGVDKDKTLSFI